MPIRKLTRNFQLTIPAEIRKSLDLDIGDYVEIEKEDDKIVLKKVKKERKTIKLGKDLDVEQIEEEIEMGMEECQL